MAEWVLILSMAFGFGGDGKASSLHSVDGFRSQELCEAARAKVVTMDRVAAVCVRKQ